MKIAMPDFRAAKAWIPERPARFIRHYVKEIVIALALAMVAAIIIEPLWAKHERRLKEQAIQDDLKAVATLEVFDRNKPLGQGSGFFITPSGVLVTNFHVIKGATKVIAHLPSGAYYLYRSLRAYDEKADIAVLQFDARETPSIKGFGDSDSIKIGDEVYALGTPNGLEATYSAGTISNPSRQVDGQTFIQFSAPISPGSSGGGLFDLDGEVIGITAATANIRTGPQAGLAQNLNLAVPVNRVKSTLNPEGGYELQRDSPGYYYSLGNLADNKRQWDRAIQLYAKALSVDPNYTDAYMGLAGDYYEEGDYRQEVSNYEKAAISNPGNADAWYYLGTAYEDVGEFDDAVVAYNKALMINPAYKDALHDLSLVYIATGNTKKARGLLSRLMAADRGWGKELQLLISRVAP
jgi:S1-C subfamily serine protease